MASGSFVQHRLARVPKIDLSFGYVGLLIAVIFFALLVGLVVAMGQPLLLAAVIGPLAGAVALRNWRLCFWSVVVGFLVINGPIQQFAHSVGKITWAFSGLSLMLLAMACVHMLGQFRSSNRAPTSGMAWFVLFFFACASVSSLLLSGLPGEFAAGFKRYFQAWGVFFALAVLPASDRDLKGLARVGVIVGALHLPFACYQYLAFVRPLQHASVGIYDTLVGVFEGGGEAGGASGVMSLYLVTLFAMALRLWVAGWLSGWRFLAALLVFGTPLAMGEAKIIVVVAPIAVAVALMGQWTRPKTWFVMALSIIASVGLGIHFVNMNAINGNDWARALDNVLAYNIGSSSYDGSRVGLNRSTVLGHWWAQHGAVEPHYFLLGHGIGASYFATSALAPGHLFLQYPFMNINLTTLSTVLWDLGIVGALSFLIILGAAWKSVRRGIRAANGLWQAEVFRAAEVSLVVCLVSLAYSNSLISFGSHGTVFALTLGVCAYAGRWASEPERFKS